MSHGTKIHRFWPKLKNRRFESKLSKITRPIIAIKSLRFDLFLSFFSIICCKHEISVQLVSNINQAEDRHVVLNCTRRVPWWRHQMETFSALLAICAGNSPVPGEFPTQRPVTRSFDVFFGLRLNKRLSKNGEDGDLRHNRVHYDVIVMYSNLKPGTTLHRLVVFWYSSKWHHLNTSINSLHCGNPLRTVDRIKKNLEIVDQWSTRIPPAHRRGWQWAMGNGWNAIEHCSKSQGSHFESDIADNR